MGELTSIVYKPKGAAPNPDGYVRIPLSEATLLVDYGIEGDTKGGKGNRQLNVMAAETVAELAEEGFHVAPGQLGEQLLISGIDIDALPAGTLLRIGETASIKTHIPRTGCGKFERYQEQSPERVQGRIGMMAVVVTGGPIRVGDSVTLVDAE